MKKQLVVLVFIYTLNGCFYERTKVPDQIELVNYPKQLSTSNDKEKKEFAAAWEDFILASNRCRIIHNNYEIGYKNAEQAKLIVGGIGGIAGITGAIIVTAGSGAIVGGIAAGVSGMSSMILGNSEKGPLGTNYYLLQKEGIARQIQRASVEAQRTDDPKKIYSIASKLAAACLSAELE
ncbi:hypothetical protein [Escherichia sp. E4742]|uniref:hypothetical protein n=1 Tax=Escherichia sp. E4742 TaxID=2044467 RepID=UPI0010FE4774|nr:hypothetical protein [Escherichia sp. E4742]QCT87965.1 hypothetical protein FEM44_12560 [Escherichia sp. E4742]TLJ07195.1 hypothetical protein FEK62_12560 [Escherichia sp. E4742]